MLKSKPALALCAASFAVACVAQSSQPEKAHSDSTPDRTFAVVERSSMRTFQGSWAPSAPLFRYVHDHPGTYVVFSQDGALYRLDAPDRLAEVQRLYAPMRELSAKQDALAHVQQPLAQEQRNLGGQQRSTSDPMEKGRIGAAQGALGQEQGELGALQGELGRQQGEVARAAYRRMQAIFDQCLADHSCARLTT